jgi:hypothetical protein
MFLVLEEARGIPMKPMKESRAMIKAVAASTDSRVALAPVMGLYAGNATCRPADSPYMTPELAALAEWLVDYWDRKGHEKLRAVE